MPDLTAQANELKQAPDPALQQELQHPSGAVAPFLVMSEAQRRQLTRQAAQAQQSQGQSGSVYDDIVRSMMARQPPQNLPAAPAGMAPMGNAMPGAPGAAPQNFQAPPTRMMAAGGLYDDEDDDEFSPEDPFLDANANPFLQSPQAQAHGIAAIGAPLEGGTEASPDQFMQALGGGAGDITEASPEDFLKALSVASLQGGGHGGRKGGKGGKGKGADATGGGKISKVLNALGKMGGKSHGIGRAATIHFPHFATLHPMQQHHAQGFHFAEGGMHFARGGANQIVDGTQVNPDGSTTYDWHDAAGNRHRTTMPPGFNVGRTTKGGGTRGGSSRGPKPNKWVDPEVDRPGTDPETGKPYKKGVWDREWLADPYTNQPIPGSEQYVHHKQSAYANRPYGLTTMSVEDAVNAVTNGGGVFLGTPNGPRLIQNTPEDLDLLRKSAPHGFRSATDRATGLPILTPFTPQERETIGPMYDPNTRTYVPGVQRETVPMFPGQATPTQAAPPQAPPVIPQGGNLAPQPTPTGAPAAGPPAAGAVAPAPNAPGAAAGALPPELRPQPGQGLIPTGAAGSFRTASSKAGIPREAAIALFGDPDAPNSPGLIGLADYANDPAIVKEVGNALNYTDNMMMKAAGNNQMDLSIGPIHIAGGQIGEYVMKRWGVAPELAKAMQEQEDQILGHMSPIARRIFDQTITARDTAMGMRVLYGGIGTDSSVAATIRQVPAMGVTAMNPYQMKDQMRGLAGELHNNVTNVKGLGLPPDIEELMWNAPGLVENRMTGAYVTRPQIRGMLRKFGQPDDEAHVNALAKKFIINYGYAVPDEDPRKPETTAEAPLREPKPGMSEFYPGSTEPHLADWARANAATNVQGVPKQIGEPGWTPEEDLRTTTPQTQTQQTKQTQQTQTYTPTGQGALHTFGDVMEGAAKGFHPLDVAGSALQIPEAIAHPGEAVKAFANQQLEQARQEQQNVKDIRTSPWKVLGRDIGASLLGPLAPLIPGYSAMEAEKQKRLAQPQPAAPLQPAPAAAAPAPAPTPQAAPPPARPQEDQEQILRRAQEIQEERRRKAEQAERDKAQQAAPTPAPTPPPQQAEPAVTPEGYSGPLPWERARGGQIFDRRPTRGETLSALTRR